jgi:Mor family transcriptional regulator
MNARKILCASANYVTRKFMDWRACPFMHKNKKTARNKAIYADKKGGMLHKDMAIKYGISVGRVYQILKIYFYKKRDKK